MVGGLFALLLAPAAAAPSPLQAAPVLMRQYVIIRVPVRMQPVVATPRATTTWNERRGPRCLPVQSIVGATVSQRESVDLVMRDRSRVRAKLGRRCPALDFYYGFYLRPGGDGQICEDRDSVHSRMGGECGIDAFRGLVPVRLPVTPARSSNAARPLSAVKARR